MKKLLTLGLAVVIGMIVGIVGMNIHMDNNAVAKQPSVNELVEFYVDYEYGDGCRANDIFQYGDKVEYGVYNEDGVRIAFVSANVDYIESLHNAYQE